MRGCSTAANRVVFLLGLFLFSFPFVSASTFDATAPLTFNVFLFLAIGALALFFIGAFARSILMMFVGIVLILLAGFLMMNGSILIPIGFNETYVYGDNFTDYHWDYDFSPPPTVKFDAAYLFHKENVKTYEAWDDGNNVFFGFLIIILAVILMITVPSEAFKGGDA